MSKSIVVILAVIVLLTGCNFPALPTTTPTAQFEPTPTAQTIATPTQTIYNRNSNLALGGCNTAYYMWNDMRRYYNQCYPDGYSLFKSATGYPIDINHTGAGYSYLVGGRKGFFGFTLPPTTIPQTCVAIKVYGDAHIWGNIGEYSLQSHISISGASGRVQLGNHLFEANGGYMAVFYADITRHDTYDISVYFNFLFASATADSYVTIERIEVVPVSIGHCGGKPSI